MFIRLLAFFFLFSVSAKGQEAIAYEDAKDAFSLLARGSYLQFTQVNNLYYLGAGVPATWYAFENDLRVKTRYGGSEIKNFVDHVGDAGVIFNFPVIPLAFYYVGRSSGNNRHVQFAKETFAATYLTLIESGLLSYFFIHARPEDGNISFWESDFRGNSSWPSGHIVPYATLFFKTLQFYGPAWSTLPFALTVVSSMQRIQDQKHWLSDVTASFFLAAFASEGVRAAGNYRDNHPVYRWIYEHDLQVGILPYRQAIGPRVAFTF
jgi:undecaprenyl-diphosphatase